ncbi:MAG: hypothetical protein GY909_18665 [Oligoflexia bacterium]|nr:hypothetical protein [Oligoflexia bacterium]
MIKLFESIDDIPFSERDFHLSSPSFLKYFEKSKCTSSESGWRALHFANHDSFLPGYIKGHSYGEYIFDWAWADLYQRAGVNYYPKLIHAIPFTPVNSPKFYGDKEKLFNAADEFYQQTNLQSQHFLFINDDEAKFLEGKDLFTQKTIQYHWKNEFEDFDGFLSSLKTRKRKQIKKERRKVSEYPLKISKVNARDLSLFQKEQIYELYISTIDKKYSHPYLNQEFFQGLEQGFFFIAKREQSEQILAMSLFFENSKTLYGRYWGIKKEEQENFPLLHFEMCYYLGMDYCFEKKIQVFEAGAQGEQKLLRGFRPVEILSSHRLKNEYLEKIIKEHVAQQNQITVKRIEELCDFLPYRSN